MSNALTQALMAQTKFTPDPANTYQSNLHSGTPGAVSVGNEGSAAMQLARSLGVLGDAVGQAAEVDKKLKHKVSLKAAEEAITGKTPEQIKTMSALDLLSGSRFAPQDSPYAKVILDKMRGQIMGDQARLKYEEEVIRQNKFKDTGDQQVADFNEFIQKERAGITNIGDVAAFNKGFFEKHTHNQVAVAHSQISWRAEQDRLVRIASIGSNISRIAETAPTTSKEDIVTNLSATLLEGMAAKSNPGERIALLKEGMLELAHRDPNWDKIKHIIDNTIIGYKDEKPLYAKDYVKVTDIQDVAARRRGEVWDKEYQETQESLRSGSVVDMWRKMEGIKEKNPVLYEAVAKDADRIIADIQKRELKELATRNRAAADVAAMEQARRVWRANITAFKAGIGEDIYQKPVAGGLSDLHKFAYDTHDPSTNTLTKKNFEWSQEVVNTLVREDLAAITKDPRIPEDQKVREQLKVLTYPPASHVAKAFGRSYQQAVDGLNAATVKDKDALQKALNGPLKEAVEFFKANPEDFAHAFDQRLVREIGTLRLLSGGSDDLTEAAGLFVSGRDALKDPDGASRIKALTSEALRGVTLDDFIGIDGRPNTLNTSIGANSILMEEIFERAKFMVAAGEDPAYAARITKEQVAKSHYFYRDTAVPRTIFNGVAAGSITDQAKFGKEVLDNWVKAYAADRRIEEKDVTVSWDPYRQTFNLYGGPAGGSVPGSYTINDITWQANDNLKKLSQKAGRASLTYEDAMKLREETPDVTTTLL